MGRFVPKHGDEQRIVAPLLKGFIELVGFQHLRGNLRTARHIHPTAAAGQFHLHFSFQRTAIDLQHQARGIHQRSRCLYRGRLPYHLVIQAIATIPKNRCVVAARRSAVLCSYRNAVAIRTPTPPRSARSAGKHLFYRKTGGENEFATGHGMGMAAHQQHLRMHAQDCFQRILSLEFIKGNMGAKHCQTFSRKGLKLLSEPNLLVLAEATFIASRSHQTYIIHHNETHSRTLERSVRCVDDTRISSHIPEFSFHAVHIPVVVAWHAGPWVRKRIQGGPAGSQERNVIVHQIPEKDGKIDIGTFTQFTINRSAGIAEFCFVINLGITYKSHAKGLCPKRKRKQDQQQTKNMFHGIKSFSGRCPMHCWHDESGCCPYVRSAR